MKHRLLTIFAAFTFGLSVFVGVLAMPASASAASSVTIYNNIPDPEPGNVASLGYEATSTSEFGGAMQFDGTKRDNPTAAVLMSSWACENGHWSDGDCSTAEGATFTHPITLNVYEINPDNSPGSLVGSTTETFTMPYRPSADNANCSGGAWYDGATCYNGEAFTISFELDGVTLPDEAIVSVAYNTSRHGASPIGTDTACFATTEGCPYDSLNVGTNATPSVGVPLPNANDAYLDSTWTGAYCDGGAGGTGTFRLDAGCWTGFLPAIKVDVKSKDKDRGKHCKRHHHRKHHRHHCHHHKHKHHHHGHHHKHHHKKHHGHHKNHKHHSKHHKNNHSKKHNKHHKHHSRHHHGHRR